MGACPYAGVAFFRVRDAVSCGEPAEPRPHWRPDTLVCPSLCPRSRSAGDVDVGARRLACAGILMPETTDTTWRRATHLHVGAAFFIRR